MKSQLLIPDKIKVGFQKRDDTYTKMLGYIIYYDGKGVLRKEKSWTTWRDKKIEPVDGVNVPTEGFVLNRSGGGSGGSRHWHGHGRSAFIRVYDPRGWEFEISLPNLLFILAQCDCSRGKGLEGKFVYAWDGQDLVLLPVGSEEFKQCQSFTALQSQGVKAKEMTPGLTYTTKRQVDLVFLGRFDYHFMYQPDGYRGAAKADAKGVEKRWVFWDIEGKRFEPLKDLKSVATAKSDAVSPDYAKLVSKWGRSEHGSAVVELYLEEVPSKNEWQSEEWFFEESHGVFVSAVTYKRYHNPIYGYRTGPGTTSEYIATRDRYEVIDGVLVKRQYRTTAYPPALAEDRYGLASSSVGYRPPSEMRLFGKTDGGGKFRVTYGTFTKG